jgi:hypothetical protein
VPRPGITICRVLYFIVKCVCYSKKTVFLGKIRKSTALRQIDFWCKTLLPWQELKNGPATADKSILLDYISPIPIVCAWQALKKQHMSVVATSLGLLLLQALTIISTGLMVLTPTRLTMSNVNLVALNKLNWTGGDNYDFWDPSPAYIAYAVLNKDLAYPEGTQRNQSIQCFVWPTHTTR